MPAPLPRSSYQHHPFLVHRFPLVRRPFSVPCSIVVHRLAIATLSAVLALGVASPAVAAPVDGLAAMGEQDHPLQGDEAVTSAATLSGVRGPDVASHQHPDGYAIQWSRTRAAGAKFAFVKATEGTTYTNPYFAGDFAAIASVGMVRGTYHYARPKKGAASPVAQARHFVSVTGRLNLRGDLPAVLDLERNDGLNPAALISWTKSFLSEVTRLTGRRPIIYTYPAFWRERMSNTKAFAGYPLWIATWASKPQLVGGWSTYTFWQYTDRAALPGMKDPVDMSVFHGSAAALARLANPSAAAVVVPKLTAKLSKKKTKVGHSVTLKGQTSSTLARETVYRQGYWSHRWHTWSTTTVSATGRYSFTIKPTRKATNRYRVYVRATTRHTAAASPTVKLKVT